MAGNNLFNHGPGKGSVDRTTDDRAFQENFALITWDGLGMRLRRTGLNRYVKGYGPTGHTKLNEVLSNG